MYGSTPVQIPFSKQTNPSLVVAREEATSGNTAPRWTNPKGNKRKKTSAVIGCKSKGKKKVIAARRLVRQRKVDSDAAAEGGKGGVLCRVEIRRLRRSEDGGSQQQDG